MSRWELVHADCIDAMRDMDAESIDAIVTDPPYGLSFMGREWDHGVPGVEFWTEALRVAKPGAHLVAFGGTRTFHRLACAIEDAGWDVRDCLSWLYGSGFPKSLDVSKAIDKAAGAEREVVGLNQYAAKRTGAGKAGVLDTRGPGLGGIESSQVTAPATDAARAWQGWGTALKPAWEPVILARKPLVGTVASNVLAHGVGGLNIDGCRIGTGEDKTSGGHKRGVSALHGGEITHRTPVDFSKGRWPANVVLDEEAAAMLDAQTGERKTSAPGSVFRRTQKAANIYGDHCADVGREQVAYGDSGGASRFFYTAKASRKERGDGNTHPTVKPQALMRWLVRMVTPPGGLVLDPFNGSGSTGVASIAEGFRYIGCEREAEYVEISRSRLSDVEELQRGLF